MWQLASFFSMTCMHYYVFYWIDYTCFFFLGISCNSKWQHSISKTFWYQAIFRSKSGITASHCLSRHWLAVPAVLFHSVLHRSKSFLPLHPFLCFVLNTASLVFCVPRLFCCCWPPTFSLLCICISLRCVCVLNGTFLQLSCNEG